MAIGTSTTGLTFFSGRDVILLADTENARAYDRLGDVRARQLLRRGQGRVMMGEGDVRRRQGDRAVNGVFLMGVAMVRLEMDENILGFLPSIRLSGLVRRGLVIVYGWG